MDGPNTVRLQRRRNELPPDQLYVERRGKRKHDGSVDEGARGYYVRQKRDSDALEPAASNDERTQEQRRIFHLQQPSALAQGGKTRKRKQNDEFATVVEKKQRQAESNPVQPTFAEFEESPQVPDTPALRKRPGRGSALRPRGDKPSAVEVNNHNVAARQQQELHALAQEMHQFALDELAKTPKPEIKTKPKLAPSRSRALHQEHSNAPKRPKASQGKDEDSSMDSDGEYVYDTYILAPVPTPTPAENPIETTKTLATPNNVGYLIISEDDEKLWENYMHDIEGPDSEPSDEDDENAEDYYGADYPSDELASDDEHDRGAYGYRARRGSNDEQYNLNDDDDDDDDDDEATWSDEEEFRMMNPFARKSQIPKQFAKYLNRDRAGERGGGVGEEDDEDV